jgi:putative endopeptidase
MRRRSTLPPLLLLTASLLVLGCGRSQPSPPPESTGALSIDEAALPPVLRFAASDLDSAKDPCTNFIAYANANWLAANPIPPDRISWGPGGMLVERSLAIQRQLAEHAAADPGASGIDKIIGDFWATGMDQEAINRAGIGPLEPQLQEIEELTDSASIAAYLRTIAARGEGQVFGFGPEADFKDSSMTIAFVTQGGLGLPDKTYYVDEDKADTRAAYLSHIARVLELSGVPAAAAKGQAEEVMRFETRLAAASKSSEDFSRDVSLFYHPISPSEADQLTPHFSWSAFFAAQGISVPEQFSLSVPAFHQEVSTMIADEPVAAWQAYLRFHVVDDASPFLADPFVQANFDFYGKTLNGQQELPARWKRVLEAIEANAGEAMGQRYVEVAFPPEAKRQMEQLVGNLGTALGARIGKLEWMTEETKTKALEKLATFKPKVGYPDRWRDWSGLATDRTSLLANVHAATAFNYRWQLDKVGKPVDPNEWGMTPQTVNAYYNPLQNEIVFPAAILQPPFFDPSADAPMNYGGIGAVIGHEMTHGYDDQGSRFAADGNFENWWSEADAAGFAARTKQLVAQIDAYDALPGLKVNGALTLGENIADLGGLATAYDAMVMATAGADDTRIDGLARDQRFFLAFATVWRSQVTEERMRVVVATDPHAPPHVRAVAAPSNLPAFAAAFGCEEGAPMARPAADRVVIW